MKTCVKCAVNTTNAEILADVSVDVPEFNINR